MKSRAVIYKEVLTKAIRSILTELDEENFDLDSINIEIKLTNNDFNETFEFKS